MNQRGSAKSKKIWVRFLLHEKVSRSTQRIVRELNLSRLSILGRIHQILRSMVSLKIAMDRMERKIASRTLTVMRTSLRSIAPSTRGTGLSVSFAGLTHRAIVARRRSVAPGPIAILGTLASHSGRRRSTAGNEEPNRPRKQHSHSSIKHGIDSLCDSAVFLSNLVARDQNQNSYQ